VGSNTGSYGALLLGGLLGSVGHCLGMCGPLVVMVGIQLKAQGPASVRYHLLYHGSRIVVYALLGAIVGTIGSVLGLGSRLSHLAGIVSLLLGLVLVLFGLGYLGWLPLGRLERAGDWPSRAMGRALKQGGLSGVLLLGALNGLLPCGLVYSALLVAASMGGALPGALGMAFFGIGTIPALLVAGVGAGVLGVRIRQALVRITGILIIVVGLQLALRGLATLGIVPHLQLGELVVW